MYSAIAVIALSAVSVGCSQNTSGPQSTQAVSQTAKDIAPKTTLFNVDYERFTLDNGLTVILHVDRSDPVAAVALTAHVGSAREK